VRQVGAVMAQIALAAGLGIAFLVWVCGVPVDSIVGGGGQRVQARTPEYDVMCPGWGAGSVIHHVSDAGRAVGTGREPDGRRLAIAWHDGTTVHCSHRGWREDAVASDGRGRVALNLGRLGLDWRRAAVGLPGEEPVPLAVPAPECSSRVCDMNRAGTAVGVVVRPGEAGRACVWDASGALTMLDDAPGCAVSISNASVVAGFITEASGRDIVRLWLPEAGGWRSVDLIRDLNASARPDAVSDHGVVVGTIGLCIPFRWDRETGLHTLPVPGGLSGTATDVNVRGEVVGRCASDEGSTALLWRGREVIDLNTRISAMEGARLCEATAINDAGMIACVALRHDRREAVLLIPRDPMREAARP